MIVVSWVIAGFILVLLLCNLRAMLDAHEKEMRRIMEVHADQSFKGCVQHLKIAETAARHNFRLPHSGEIPWDYVVSYWYTVFRGEKYMPWGDTQWTYNVITNVKLYMWITNDDGIIHRVGRLPHDGIMSYVLLCSPITRVKTYVETHEIQDSPVVTCLHCVARAN